MCEKMQNLPTRTVADGELAFTSFKSPLRIFRFQWDGMIQQDLKNKEQNYVKKKVSMISWVCMMVTED